MCVIYYGGFIVSLISPDKDGKYANIVTHYGNIEEYQRYNLGKVGPALGRFANRIANAQMEQNSASSQDVSAMESA